MANDDGTFGEPAKQYALQLTLEIVNEQKADYSFTNQHMARGHEQEPIARILYENEYFVDITSGVFFDCTSSCLFSFCSLRNTFLFNTIYFSNSNTLYVSTKRTFLSFFSLSSKEVEHTKKLRLFVI